VAVLSLGYASFSYLGLASAMGFGQYRVALQLPKAGGLYAGALVALRGVEIGKVEDVVLADTGVTANLSLDSRFAVPAGVSAKVRNTSAIGEQYVELVPISSGTQVLSSGSVIHLDRSEVPTTIGDVLDSTDSLVRSVSQPALRKTLDELATAFAGSGQDMQRFLDSSHDLLTEVQANIKPTATLINDLQPVLATQVRDAPDIRSYFSDLASVTAQLRESDSELRGILDGTPAFAGQLDSLFSQIRPTLPMLLANLSAVGQVLEIYLPNLQHTVVVLPALVNDVQTILWNNRGLPNTAALDLTVSLNYPPLCTSGYSARDRDPADLSPIPPVSKSYCQASKSSPVLARGARQDPCPNDPHRRSADAHGCGLDFQTPREAAEAANDGRYVPDGAPSAMQSAPQGVPYDPVSGLFFGAGGKEFRLGDHTREGTVAPNWQSFFLDPLQTGAP
jgi:phospholipid/cholesterol/gamma-HCH transport system substrate-binding protein